MKKCETGKGCSDKKQSHAATIKKQGDYRGTLSHMCTSRRFLQLHASELGKEQWSEPGRPRLERSPKLRLCFLMEEGEQEELYQLPRCSQPPGCGNLPCEVSVQSLRGLLMSQPLSESDFRKSLEKCPVFHFGKALFCISSAGHQSC